MTLVASAVLAVAMFCLWVLWQGGLPLLVANPLARLAVAGAALILTLVGFLLLVRQAQPHLKRRLIWAGALTVGLAVLVVWYHNSVLRVSPGSARIPVGSTLPLIAAPLSAVERFQGRSHVNWTSSEPTVVSVIPDSIKTSGSQGVIVKALKPGRATIFAVRGMVGASARVSVEDSDGVVPPLCKAGSTARTVHSAAQPTTAAPAAQNPLRCVAGSITSPAGQPLARARISLTAALGSDTLWTQHELTDPVDGRYEFRIPADSATLGAVLSLAVHQQVGEKSPVWFIPTNWGLDTTTTIIHSGLLQAGVYRDVDIRLHYSPRSTFAMIFLLIPAILGLLSTVLYFGAYRPDEMISLNQVKPIAAPRHRPDSLTTPPTEARKKTPRDREQFLTRIYVFGNALTWGLLLALLALLYAFRGVQSVSLFSESITIPFVAPAFAFLGVLVYAIYVLAEDYVQRPRSDNRGDAAERHRILLALGNRIVIAPYVAIVAVLALFDTADHRMIPFVAFFTGLWIEPVLGTLKGIGDRLVNRAPLPIATPLDTEERLAQAQALLEQEKDNLTRSDNVVGATVEAKHDGTGGEATPVIVLWVRNKEVALAEKEAPPKELRGKLYNGAPVAVPVELREMPERNETEQYRGANQAPDEPHSNGARTDEKPDKSEEAIATPA